MTADWEIHRRPTAVGYAALCAVFVVVACSLLFGPWQTMTGDETRYLMYSVSILKYGRFVMTLPEWQATVLSATGAHATALPTGDSHTVLWNGVYLPALLSPVAATLSLAGLRAFTLLTGLFGLFCLYRLCVRISKPSVALLTIAIAALTIPLLPYLHLFYMETYLFALVCCAWERLQTNDRTLSGDLLTALILIAIPFVHLRGSVVAAALYTLLFWQVYSRGLTRRCAALALLAVIAFGILVAMNVGIYGAIAGPVNQARPPLPWHWFPVIAMQLFSVHHGLFAYAPVWAIGYAGLCVGTLRGWTIPRQGFVLAALAAVTSVGAYPGECWPARFWVLAIPMLAVGFCTWWVSTRHVALKLIPLALTGFTLLNTYLFYQAPNAFIFNRQATTSYQNLFDRLGHFHFGLVLPDEIYEAPYLAAVEAMTLGAGLFILFMILSVIQRRGAIFAVPAAVLLLAAADLTRVSVLSPAQYGVTETHDRLSIQLHTPLRAAFIQFGDNREPWPGTDRIDMAISGTGGRTARTTLVASRVLSASCIGNISSILIRSRGDLNIAAEVKYHLQAYRSDSLLRNSFSFLRDAC